MAIKAAVRWKPDTYRTSLETTVAGMAIDGTGAITGGTVVQVAQLVAYDDAVVTGASYKPGDPATEQNVTVLYEEPVMLALQPFVAMTAAAATQAWSDALSSFGARVGPAAPTLVKAIRAARRSNPVVVA